MTVYKIMTRDDWAAALKAGVFQGSDDDKRDGFIHLSAKEQIAGTLAKHFAGQKDLLLIAFEAEALGAALRWEESRGGALFPHLYGPLDPTLAVSVEPSGSGSG